MNELDTTLDAINEADYPTSPSYYRHCGDDARNLVNGYYWTGSAMVHLYRAGRKPGETFADAIANAFLCLALWFRSQGLPVPYYSAELARLRAELAAYRDAYRTESREGAQIAGELRAENARLRAELAALRPDGTPLESAPPTPAASDEWTDDELAEWLDAKHGTPETKADGDIVWPGCGVGKIGNEADATMSRRWFMVDTGATRTAAEAARILNATKPADPLAELLTIETDEGLREWLEANASSVTIFGGRRWKVRGTPISYGSFGTLPSRPWTIHVLGVPDGDARDAAHALHRILTGGAA